MCERNNICIKNLATTEVNLNWLEAIGYELFWYQRVSWFLHFLQHLLQKYKERETKWKHQYQMGPGFFYCFGKKYYFIQKFSFFINNLFENIFLTSVIGLIILLYARPKCLWSILTPRESIYYSDILLKTRFS